MKQTGATRPSSRRGSVRLPHQPADWEEFRRRYRAELAARPELWQPLLEAAKTADVTLLFSARDLEHNHALVLKAFLEERLKRGRKRRSSSLS
jgi:uncharacterized protein YeaO (DUF488 family)